MITLLYIFVRILLPVLSTAAFVLVAMVLWRSAKAWSTNNRSPRVSTHATMVAKRAQRTFGMKYRGPVTYHYATFEFDTGDRMELMVSYGEYGSIFEGESGTLAFQGTRFLSFDRIWI